MLLRFPATQREKEHSLELRFITRACFKNNALKGRGYSHAVQSQKKYGL